MKRKILITLIAAASAMSVNARINSSDSEGYLARAVAMYNERNYAGCIDQLTRFRQLSPASDNMEEADFYTAMSMWSMGDNEALTALGSFKERYPLSVYNPRVQLAIADWYFDCLGKADSRLYGFVLDEYRLVDVAALTSTDADACRFRQAYCCLMKSKLDEAEKLYDLISPSSSYHNAVRFYQGYIAYARKDYCQALQIFKSIDTAQPPADMTDFYLSQLYFIEGDYNSALSTARRVLAGRATDGLSESRLPAAKAWEAEASRVAGESLYNLGDEEGAIPYLRRYAAAVESPQLSTLYILGVSEYRAGEYERAITSLTPVTTADNAMGQSAYLTIGQAYIAQHNYNSAIIAFEKSYRMTYDRDVRETAFYNYAVAQMQGGRVPFGSSVAAFEDFLSEFPDSRFAPEIEEYIVTGYMSDNNYAAALRSINAIRQPSAAVMRAKQQVLYTLGTRELAAGNVNEALQHLTEARSMSGYDAAISRDCDLWIGDCLYRQGKYAEASRDYQSYLKSSKNSDPNRAVALYNLAYARFGDKKFSDALGDFERFVKSPGKCGSPAIADAYNRIGDCYYYATRFDRAATAYDKAYSLDPSVGDYALYQKALMKGLARDYNAKISGLSDMMARFPSSGLVPSALLEIAESYTELGMTDKTISTYTQLSTRYPSTPQGRRGCLLLASTYLYNGNRRAAIDTYKKVITSYPTSEEAVMASDDLKRLYADDGLLSEYVRFVESIPDAPRIEASELDNLTFDAARREYLADGSTVKLADYIKSFPRGASAPQALLMLAESALDADRSDDALDYASTLVAGYPDSEYSTDALLIKADVEFSSGMGERALSSYRELESRAPSSILLNRARLGIMRVSRDLGLDSDVIDAADKLLGSSTIGADQRSEAVFSRALAMRNVGRVAEAEEAWSQLASDTGDLFGAKSAFYLADHYFVNGELGKARNVVDALIDSNTPHNYWLARGFILLSDIYRAEGSTFEADEYLKSLRENYPGSEPDIFNMIDQRLK